MALAPRQPSVNVCVVPSVSANQRVNIRSPFVLDTCPLKEFALVRVRVKYVTVQSKPPNLTVTFLFPALLLIVDAVTAVVEPEIMLFASSYEASFFPVKYEYSSPRESPLNDLLVLFHNSSTVTLDPTDAFVLI